MIAPTHRLPVVRQCKLLELSRSTAYYRPRQESEENLAVMKEIDRLYMERPTSGSRTIKSLLEAKGTRIARSRIVRLMRLMGLGVIYPKRRTSSPGQGHKIYPYLLRSIKVTRPREVYAADITYIPMAKGFLYLVAVIDWYSRSIRSTTSSATLRARSSITSGAMPRSPCTSLRTPTPDTYYSLVPLDSSANRIIAEVVRHPQRSW